MEEIIGLIAVEALAVIVRLALARLVVWLRTSQPEVGLSLAG